MTGSHQERRERHRHTRDEPVTCRVPALPVNARLLDISHDGCRMELPNRQLGRGTTINLDVPGAEPVAGLIVWRRKECVGVKFTDRLTQEQAIGLRLQAPPAETPLPQSVLNPQPVEPHWLRLRYRVAG